jgi:hypothetical protein
MRLIGPTTYATTVDVMAFTHQYPNSTIILIAGDRDYSYMVSFLRNNLHYIIIITPGPRFLGTQANEILEWKSLFRSPPPPPPPPPRPRPVPYIPPNGTQYFSLDSNVPHFQMSNLGFVPSSSQDAFPRPHSMYQSLSADGALPSTRMDTFYRPPESKPVVMKTDNSIPPPTLDPLPIANTIDWGSEDDLDVALTVPLPISPRSSPSVSSPCLPNEAPVEEAPTLKLAPIPPPPEMPPPETVKVVAKVASPPRPTNDSTRPFKLDNDRIKDLFSPLIRVLLQLSSQGTEHPLRSVVAETLMKQKPNPYSKCKASNWTEYSKMAEGAGVIILGLDPGFQGRDWVELKPTFRSVAWKSMVKIADEPSTTSRIPKAFKPLLQFLDINCQEGKMKLPRSVACEHILRNHRGLFEKHGYSGWREYATAADTAGYIKLTGGQQGGGDNYISLVPKWRNQIPAT